jgi:hypothetical protein
MNYIDGGRIYDLVFYMSYCLAYCLGSMLITLLYGTFESYTRENS